MSYELPDNTPQRTWKVNGPKYPELELVKIGCYLIEHLATGRCIVGTSKNMTQDVIKEVTKIYKNKHPVKLLYRLCEHDPDIRVYEYPTPNMRAATALQKAIQRTIHPTYLLLN